MYDTNTSKNVIHIFILERLIIHLVKINKKICFEHCIVLLAKTVFLSIYYIELSMTIYKPFE